MERIVKLFFLFLISLISFDCGVYGFRGNNPPPGINSIAVPTFVDVSGFAAPELADQFTQRLKIKIIGDNTFRVADRNKADAVLKCTITNVKDEALVVASGENVSRRKVTITISVVFDNLKTQKNIWTKNFENYGEYESSDNTFSKRTDGIAIAIERITEDMVVELTSSW
jgi:hypothetical protein